MGPGLTSGAQGECLRSCRWSWKASRQTDFHSQIPRVLSYLVLMVVSLLCRSPSNWARGLSCEMSPTARNRVVASSTWVRGKAGEWKWAFASKAPPRSSGVFRAHLQTGSRVVLRVRQAIKTLPVVAFNSSGQEIWRQICSASPCTAGAGRISAKPGPPNLCQAKAENHTSLCAENGGKVKTRKEKLRKSLSTQLGASLELTEVA